MMERVKVRIVFFNALKINKTSLSVGSDLGKKTW